MRRMQRDFFKKKTVFFFSLFYKEHNFTPYKTLVYMYVFIVVLHVFSWKFDLSPERRVGMGGSCGWVALAVPLFLPVR